MYISENKVMMIKQLYIHAYIFFIFVNRIFLLAYLI